jgi:hypothetical protein
MKNKKRISQSCTKINKNMLSIERIKTIFEEDEEFEDKSP